MAIVVALAAGRADAQPVASEARVGADVAIAFGTFLADGDTPASFLTIDSVSNTRLTGGLTLVARPLLRKRAGSEWDPTLAQLVVRHETTGRVAMRLEGGYLAPPAGLGTLAMRANLNPTIASAVPYGEALPRLERDAPALRLYAPTYPLGAQASFSSAGWDLRAAVVDASLLRLRLPFESDQPARAAQVVVGGGLTPKTGVRLGGWFSTGTYLRRSELAVVTAVDRRAMLTGIEAEVAFGWTRIAGEWVMARMDQATGRVGASLVMIEALQTLAPRWFLAGRLRTTDAPVAQPGPAAYSRVRGSTGEITLGYRVSPELTLRTGYQAVRDVDEDGWAHRMGMSMVWARRWF